MDFHKIIDSYNQKDVVDISPTLEYGEEWLYKKLSTFKKNYYHNEYRLILYFNNDHKEYIDYPSMICYSLYRVIYKLDISEFFVILISKQDVSEDLKLSKDILKDNIQEIFHIDESIDIQYFNNIDTPSVYSPRGIDNQNTSCKKLWNHLHIHTNGDVLPCCVADHNQPIGNITKKRITDILKSPELENLRQNMLDGYKISSCKYCYENEKQGLESLRQPLTSDIPKNITSFDIRFSNICNLKCRMCTGEYSSRIAKEEFDNYGVDYQIVELESINGLDDILDLLKNAEDVYFAGGEPLIMDIHYKILDKLLELEKFDIKLGYNTNFTKLNYKNKSVIDYWKKFSNITVGASLDGIEKHIEYIRNGTKWNEVLDNFNNIKTLDVKFKITSNINIYNAFNLIDAQKLWIQNGITNHHISILNNPDYLSIQILPKEFKERLILKIDEHINFLSDYKHLISVWEDVKVYLNKEDKSFLLSKFLKETERLDILRNENFEEVFTEYKNLKTM